MITMRESAGAMLRRTREEKKISIRQAADDTRMTTRHIQAIEDDNHSVFPGETYVTGFIRSYAGYLDLDPEAVLRLYRGSLLVDKEPPLAELTRPTVNLGDYLARYSRVIIFVVVLIAGAGILFSLLGPSKKELSENAESQTAGIDTFLKSSTSVPSVETEHVKLRAGFTTAVITLGKGIDFSVQNSEVYLVLKEIVAESGAAARVTLELYPGKRLLQLKENESIVVKEAKIPREFKLTFSGATSSNIKVQIDMGEENPEAAEALADTRKQETTAESRIANPDNFIIRLEGMVLNDTWVEYFIDGKPGKRGLLPRGTPILLEANDSIQLRLGNAGDVKLSINGEEKTLGQRGQQINKIIRKMKDPVEQTKFKVVIKDA